MREPDFEIIVIGGGHAGIEAALAAARMGMSAAMVTMDKNAIGRMSCNPAIGGLAKGQLVREIDALGGEMGLAIDNTGIQFRILNQSKGPAVQARRAQADREEYSKFMSRTVLDQSNLEVIEGQVVDLIIENGQCRGVILDSGEKIDCGAVIVTAGTFLNGLIHIGLEQTRAGRIGEPPAIGLTRRLLSLGIETGRLKTGTPPRLDGRTIDFSKCEIQPGDDPPPYFSNRTLNPRNFEQALCHLTYTNENTHRIIRDNLNSSAMYSGKITGIGPRYCPSIEDKVVRFSERPRHQLFLEPEGINTTEYYLNGFSSSLPGTIQLEALRTVPGLEKVEMNRAGYAIEYDYFPPHQVNITMESKVVPGLYFAGQVNGTSGYEEAAAQGLMAGINAVLKIRGEEPFHLTRSEAYIGVLLDDLVTKSTSEPYRMFTSRAEYRLNLRDDNAEDRLLEKGFALGLVAGGIRENFLRKLESMAKLERFLRDSRVKIPDLSGGGDSMRVINGFEGLKNPGIEFYQEPIYKEGMLRFGREIFSMLANEVRYDGYIKRQNSRIGRMRSLEGFKIPAIIDFSGFKGLKKEATEKLSRFRPETLGQASRISGITPGDITVLMVYLGRG